MPSRRGRYVSSDPRLPTYRTSTLGTALGASLSARIANHRWFARAGGEVLATLAPYLKAGSLIFFDEFSCPLDEFRAFEQFVRSFRVKYEVIAAVYGYTRVCIKILQ
jgi:hypothetical protein